MHHAQKVEIGVRFLLYLGLFIPLVFLEGIAFPFVTSKILAFEALTLIAFILWLYLWYINPKQFAPNGSVLAIAVGVYILVNVAAALQGVHFWTSFWSYFERMDGIFTWIALFLFFLVLGGMCKREQDWIWMFRVSLLVSIVAALKSLHFFGIFEEHLILLTRMPGVFGNPLYVGVYAMFHSFIALALFLLGEKSKETHKNLWFLFYGLGLFINLFILGLALARGPLIGFFLGITVFWFWYALWGQKRRIFFMTSGIILFFVVAAFPFWKDIMVIERIYSITQGLGADQSRAINWEVALRAFKARPFLGWGSNHYLVAQQEFYNPFLVNLVRQRFDRPHNKYLEVAVDSGALGLTSYLSIFGLTAYALFRARKKDPLVTALAAGAFGAYLTQNITAFDSLASYLPLFLLLAFSNARFFSPLFPDMKPHAGVIVGCWFLAITFLWKGVWQPYWQSKYFISTLSVEQAFPERQKDILESYQKTLAIHRIGRKESLVELGTHVLTQEQIQRNLLDFSIKEIEKEYQSFPRDDTIALILAKLYALKGRAQNIPSYREKAHKVFEDIISVFPRYFLLRQHYAVFLLEEGEFEEARQQLMAIRDFNEELFAKEKELQWQLMMTYYLAGDKNTAYQVLHKAFLQGIVYFDEPKFPIMAEIFGAEGEKEEMLTWYEAHYEKALRHPEAAFPLAYAYKHAGFKGKARLLIEELMAREPSLQEEAELFLLSLE